jgi:hypothetical protein
MGLVAISHQLSADPAFARADDRRLMTETKKALRRFPGHRARFSYDDLLELFSCECVELPAPPRT